MAIGLAIGLAIIFAIIVATKFKAIINFTKSIMVTKTFAAVIVSVVDFTIITAKFDTITKLTLAGPI